MANYGDVKRRVRDLNSRGQGPVDFESTAIPGYANSAGFVHPQDRHKPDVPSLAHAGWTYGGRIRYLG